MTLFKVTCLQHTDQFALLWEQLRSPDQWLGTTDISHKISPNLIFGSGRDERGRTKEHLTEATFASEINI